MPQHTIPAKRIIHTNTTRYEAVLEEKESHTGRLDGKVALISGGARGQGATEAQLFSREGAKVVLGDVLDEAGRQVEAAIRAAGGADVPTSTLDFTFLIHYTRCLTSIDVLALD